MFQRTATADAQWADLMTRAEAVVKRHAWTGHKVKRDSLNDARAISFDAFVKGGTYKDGGSSVAYGLACDAISDAIDHCLCKAPTAALHLRYAPTERVKQAVFGYARKVLEGYQTRPTSIGGVQRTAGQKVETMTEAMVAQAAAPASETEAIEIAEEAAAILAMLTDRERVALDHLKTGTEPADVVEARELRLLAGGGGAWQREDADLELVAVQDRVINAWHARASRAKRAVADALQCREDGDASAMLEREAEVVA